MNNELLYEEMSKEERMIIIKLIITLLQMDISIVYLTNLCFGLYSNLHTII